ncbi:TetR/AcrR family transcriptional regulator [Plantactinospora sp. B5E13]|uniref:TetR/AcrR family transcriptional regulator n=1 Tax=unclassified Plantactinospora TaxID=2631981 RepID=UPI00325D932C
MPKRVDHQARRALIAEALLRIAADRGLEEVSLRHVAAEAGVSSGMVQHYFRTKDEMMAFAMEVVRDNAQVRLAAAEQALGESPSPRVSLRALLMALLPLDERRQLDGRVALAFLAYAAVRPAIAAELGRDNALMHQWIAERVRVIRAASPAPPSGGDPLHAATALLATVEGLGVYILSGQYSPESALAVLDALLDSLLGPEPVGSAG